MSPALVVSVRIHDGRYHGAGDWPPGPARLFQALVAGAGLGGPLGNQVRQALRWLEERTEAPLIGAPVVRRGQPLMLYMPNNDLDKVGGDLRRIAEVRTATKLFIPHLFEAESPFLYVWPLDSAEQHEPHSRVICTLAEGLYQFGRGVDMAWAWGEVLDGRDVNARLSSYPGRLYRPSGGRGGGTIACLHSGSLQSLEKRYQANRGRFHLEGEGKKRKKFFTQPPKPSFRRVAYESPTSHRVYELRRSSPDAPFAPWPLVRASRLIEMLRDLAAERLRRALPAQTRDVERFIVGRSSEVTDAVPTALRARITPLPSMGHHYVDQGIRRMLVEVPAGCPLRPSDVHWAFSSLVLVDRDTGEDLDIVLTPAADDAMLAHYGVQEGKSHRTWRTVTPAVLPDSAKRRRIEPTRITEEMKGGRERALEEARAAAAVAQALRHANIRTRPDMIRVQREPFVINGARVEPFARGTRFSKERLWHVEVVFDAPVGGPLVIGDGRFLGLGVMAPAPGSRGMHAWTAESGLDEGAEPLDLTRALRRAVMATVQDVIGARTELPRFFSGHERDGSPDRTEHRHLTFAFDSTASRLLILAPHVIHRRSPTDDEVRYLQTLDDALVAFRDLRAGRAGRLSLRAVAIEPDSDPLFAASRTWESMTPYQVTRHLKHVSASESFCLDVCAECVRVGLPRPRVTPRELRGVPGVGLVGCARLIFEVAVQGPILLGKSSHLGGGLFRAVRASEPRTMTDTEDYAANGNRR